MFLVQIEYMIVLGKHNGKALRTADQGHVTANWLMHQHSYPRMIQGPGFTRVFVVLLMLRN